LLPLIARPSNPLTGAARPPGDKSISHRALMLGASAIGETAITGLLEGDDVLRTAAALRALGATVERKSEGAWLIRGRGTGGLVEPDDVLDMGNSGTAARLLLGLLATHDLEAHMTGDASLRRRPMRRVIEPLARMGASIHARGGERLPLLLRGAKMPVPIRYVLPVPSAQVKSAVLFAGLNTPGITSVVEPQPTRDHSERMLRHLGAEVSVRDTPEGREIAVVGCPELEGRPIAVPSDPSSAAFALVAALLVPDSEVTLTDVCVNPLRIGLFETLSEMGADIALTNRRNQGGEPVADVRARFSRLKGIAVPAERAPSMIDEYPVLAVAAACAEGETHLAGLAELRVKESDRLGTIAENLTKCGVSCVTGPDWLTVRGCGGPPPGPSEATVLETRMDHRIAMSLLVLGLAAARPVTIDDASFIDTSFPDFAGFMRALGANIAVRGEVQLAGRG
jgi:3-phosphoshikimate 1-carboxyvinyltransferase